MEYVIKPLDSVGHTRSSLKKLQFDSGKDQLDNYIKQYAWINHQDKRSARVFVACSTQNFREIKGYYTSSASEISIEAILEESRRGFPNKLPALLIGRLAVDRSSQSLGIGKKLLRHAFECAVEIADKTGIYAVYTQAKDEEAKRYYLKRGFIEFQDKPLSLFLPIETIKQAIANQKKT
ncbi:MAG: GNAT family N-acetyltransferase [Waterburya sp.]